MDPSSTPLRAQQFSMHEEKGGPTVKQQVLDTAASAVQSFGPLKHLCAHFCALHAYSHDLTRQVVAHHFCSHVSKDMHQCIIYDSDKADARLIGIEYLISEDLFRGLDDSEKVYWHSHKYEVTSGMLVAPRLPERAEREIVTEVGNMYGKIVHTWAIDKHPLLPLGPPQLMTSLTADWQRNDQLMAEKDTVTGISSQQRRTARTDLQLAPKVEGADAWEETKQAMQFVPEKHDVKLPSIPPPI